MTTRTRNELTMLDTVKVSDAAGDLYERMGMGALLRVPHDESSQPSLYVRAFGCFNWKDWESFPVARVTFQELEATGFIHKLTEHGEPPPEERRRGYGYRMGWREMQLNGQDADWWVLMQ